MKVRRIPAPGKAPPPQSPGREAQLAPPQAGAPKDRSTSVGWRWLVKRQFEKYFVTPFPLNTKNFASIVNNYGLSAHTGCSAREPAQGMGPSSSHFFLGRKQDDDAPSVPANSAFVAVSEIRPVRTEKHPPTPPYKICSFPQANCRKSARRTTTRSVRFPALGASGRENTSLPAREAQWAVPHSSVVSQCPKATFNAQ